MAIRKSTKRAASRPVSNARAAKKMKKQSQGVAKSLKDASLDGETKAMLVHAVPHSLSTYADQRHQYQARIVQMASEALGGIENGLVVAVASAKHKVDSFVQRQMEMAIPQAAHHVAACKGAAAVKEAEIVDAEMELHQANNVLKAAKKEQKAGDAAHTDLAGKVQDFNQLKENLENMKEEAPSKRAVGKLANDLKDFGVEAALADSLPRALAKPSSERSEFDTMTLGQLNDKLAAKSQELEAGLAQHEPGKAQRANAVATAQATHDAAKAKLDNAKAASKEADKAVKDGEGAFETAEDNLKGFASHLKNAQDGLKDAEEKLADFRKGPLETFKHLESCNKPVPAAPEAAPEPAA